MFIFIFSIQKGGGDDESSSASLSLCMYIQVHGV